MYLIGKYDPSIGKWVKEFQSPRSGKFVSDFTDEISVGKKIVEAFQSPRSGKFVSNIISSLIVAFFIVFQPPRSGKFVSDGIYMNKLKKVWFGFQSPRSGKFVSDILKENDQDFEWYPVSIP